MFACPVCNKVIKQKKNLQPHIDKLHPDYNPNPETTNNDTEELELEVETGTEEPQNGGYHCVNCGFAPINKGQTDCPKCDTHFDWSGINA